MTLANKRHKKRAATFLSYRSLRETSVMKNIQGKYIDTNIPY